MADGRKRILAALFDVRPVTDTGNLDMEKIKQIKAILNLREAQTKEETKQRAKAIKIEIAAHKEEPVEEVFFFQENQEKMPSREEILAELEAVEKHDEFLAEQKISLVNEPKDISPVQISPEQIEEDWFKNFYQEKQEELPVKPMVIKEIIPEKVDLEPAPSKNLRPLFGFLLVGFLIALVVPAAAWLGQGFAVKNEVLSSSLSAYQNLFTAKQSLEQADWQAAEKSFGLAHRDFLKAHQEITQLGQITLDILENLPGNSLVSSGSHLVRVGENLAQAGQTLTAAIKLFAFNDLFSLIKLPSQTDNNILASVQGKSLTDLIALSQDNLRTALASIQQANQELNQVSAEALPNEIQDNIVSLKEKLPLVEEMLNQGANYSSALLKMLGHNNPRQYLLIFQNNSEMRATGGFIGTYGLIALDKGAIKELFIDGVFNADGQLHEKIIPPRPIQKISTAWSMHDANWFADFPTSAQKIMWFYEKTGGPTVDGVISLTPTVIEQLLELTGPIALPEYNVNLEASNFVELVQYKVEVDYDKQLNQPKKILADFAPRFIQTLNQLPAEKQKQALEIILNGLKEKHLLAYFNDKDLENVAVQEGWSGELLSADKDYLSVVSSNINGYKTDRVVKESISHQTEIQSDGSIIDTLTITRQHQGGQEKYEWWNRVNTNYLRVYLPLGSQLIFATGQAIEKYQPPIDYQAQGFKTDPLVSAIENKMVIDAKTNTEIFEENNKTVFANWLYLSPGQTVVLTYQYKLPFRIDLTKTSDNYSLLVQKQSGSLGSQFSQQIKFPADWQVAWKYPDSGQWGTNNGQWQSDLKTDRFLGVMFSF